MNEIQLNDEEVEQIQNQKKVYSNNTKVESKTYTAKHRSIKTEKDERLSVAQLNLY